MLKILIVEDDKELSRLFAHILIKNGYTVKETSNGKDALEALERDRYDLIVTDIMMPVMDGHELVRTLREQNDPIPVLMITARDAFDDMQRGFLTGADDYMVKPINVNEMLLRIQALLRRAQMVTERRQTLGNTVLEFDTFTVYWKGNSVMLAQKEFLLLYKLASYPGRIFTRQQLMDDIWGYDSESDSHTVEVHIGRIRERLKDNEDIRIETIRGVGYKVVKK
ncbi:MAG: response regulator transcription factor [Ruminococcaceae bacterium]|nr:response regulator transcription factor [Oscillospiraceae bacterium]